MNTPRLIYRFTLIAAFASGSTASLATVPGQDYRTARLPALSTAEARLDAAPSSATVNLKGGINPARVTIAAGGTVTWVNNDDRDHHIVAGDGSFDSGNLKSGDSFSFTFSSAGRFAYACTLHPREKGVVIVR